MKRLAIAFLLFVHSVAHADNWPQWRGANHDGISKEKGLPHEWAEDKNVLWKLAMPGMGCSTPAVWGDRLFVTSEDGADIVLVCVSTSGKELWKGKIGENSRKAERNTHVF